MNSAFGVDHGYEDIEKFSMPGLGRIGGAIAGKTSQAGAAMSRSGGRSQVRVGKLRPMAGKVASKVGAGTTRLGGAMAARPGLTGGLAVGGSGVAAGGVGAGLMNRKKQF